MKYLPVLDELFGSDSCLFLLIGFAIGFAASSMINSKKKAVAASAVSFGIYAFCELLLNIIRDYLAELLGLFIGTAALGAAITFMVRFAVLRNKKPAEPFTEPEKEL